MKVEAATERLEGCERDGAEVEVLAEGAEDSSSVRLIPRFALAPANEIAGREVPMT
jgi:hypothetical protein